MENVGIKKVKIEKMKPFGGYVLKWKKYVLKFLIIQVW